MSGNAAQHPTAHKNQLQRMTERLKDVRILLDSIAKQTASKPNGNLINKQVLEALALLNEAQEISVTLTIEDDVTHSSESAQDSGIALLSDRERQIFELIVAGLSNEEIAGHTHITSSTVRTYKLRVMKKLNVSNVPDLVRLAMRSSIGDPNNQS